MKIQSNYEGNLKDQISGSSSYHVPIDLKPHWEQSDYDLALTESPISSEEVFSNSFPKTVDTNSGAGAPTFIPDESAIGQTIEVLNPARNTKPFIKMSVFTDLDVFKGSYELEVNRDFFIKNEKIFLKPNEALDRNNINPGQYSLQFD